jgi:Tfp pilus assembly protein PilF
MFDARQQRALAALRLQQYELARREATEALATDPDSHWLRLILGEACMRLRDYAAGREQAAEILRLAPECGWGHWLLGWCSLSDRENDMRFGGKANRLQRAQEAAKQALECQSSQPAFFELAAAAAMEAGDHASAMNLVGRGLALDPECQFLLRLRGQILNVSKNPGQAVTAFQASLRLAPEDHLSHRELARVLYGSGQYRAAREHIREALRLNPNDREARELISKINQMQHWLLRAATWLFQFVVARLGLIPFWLFITFAIGIPLGFWMDQPGVAVPLRAVVFIAWLTLVFLPPACLTLPLLVNMLWVTIGRDAVRSTLTWQERWDRFAPGLVVLSIVPVAIVSAAWKSATLFNVYLMLLNIALLQSGAAARPGIRWKCCIYALTAVYVTAMIAILFGNIHFPTQSKLFAIWGLNIIMLEGTFIWRLRVRAATLARTH